MTRRPLQPARIAWDADGTPRSVDFHDVYHARIGAAEQARHVFLQGNGLPGRWRGQHDFTILEIGFGLGHNFVTTWRAWTEDPQRPPCLHYVAIEGSPPLRADLQRAHGPQPSAEAARLIEAWPPLAPGLHRLDFEGGALRLLLALGDVRDLLPALDLAADAFYLDGFSPAVNPPMWEPRVMQALARRARPGATAATWSVARCLRDGLDAAGFHWQRHPGIGGKRDVLRALYQPRPGQARRPAPAKPDRVVVVGAGIAGAACAAALASQGVEVEVLESAPAPAEGASGNRAGLFHATVHRDDGPYAALFRAAALHTARLLQRFDQDRVPHDGSGMLRLEGRLAVDELRRRLADAGLPAELVQALDAGQASTCAGIGIGWAAWHYPQGGWLSPPALVRALLEHERIRLRCNSAVQALQRTAGGWSLLDAGGNTLAHAPHVVLAAAEQVGTLLSPLGWTAPEWQRSRGQVTHFPLQPGLLRRPLSGGGGYALQLPDGTLLCGATSQPDDEDPRLREADHRDNLQRLQRLCGLQGPAEPSQLQGRVGWRLQPRDRLPLAGPLPALHLDPRAQRLDQARLVPREPGLHLLCGLGSRGLTLGPLLGEVVAARITGVPVPLERRLVDPIDPARFTVRQARRPG